MNEDLALEIDRAAMLQPAEEAEVPPESAARIIDTICGVASRFATLANEQYATVISRDTMALIQGRIDQSAALLR